MYIMRCEGSSAIVLLGCDSSAGATDHPVAETLIAIAAVMTRDPKKGNETEAPEIAVTGGAVDREKDSTLSKLS